VFQMSWCHRLDGQRRGLETFRIACNITSKRLQILEAMNQITETSRDLGAMNVIMHKCNNATTTRCTTNNLLCYQKPLRSIFHR